MEKKQMIRNFIVSNFIVDDDEVSFSDSDNYFALGFVSSLLAMKLVDYVESTFLIKVNNDDLDIVNFNSIEGVVALIDRNSCKEEGA